MFRRLPEGRNPWLRIIPWSLLPRLYILTLGISSDKKEKNFFPLPFVVRFLRQYPGYLPSLSLSADTVLSAFPQVASNILTI